MKRIGIILIGLALMTNLACADNDKVTNNINELPQVSRTFLNNYFNGNKVSHIKIDKDLFLIDSYDVILTDGTSVEFNRDGEWKEVKSFQQNIPDTLILAEIRQYVSQNYPGQKIMTVERGKRKVSVDLANGLELEFDLNGNLIDIDN
jgi:hypothetical protein